MDLYGEKGRSIPQKIVIHLIEIALLWVSYWILFGHGGEWCESHLHIHNAADATDRRIIIFIFSLVTFLRISYSMSFLLKRKMQWEESVSVAFAFALYFIGFSMLVLPKTVPVAGLDYFAIFLFVLGCLLNTGGEILRDQWKKKPENRGKIYTGGFFKYSRHINYFGDLLWITAYAIITRNPWSIVIPALLFCFFAFYNAPKLDKYLKEKYGKAYDDYARKTRMLIPYIY
jgi:protein-S-isoprenylcysteine O-methyltransferase Ste14